MRITILLFVSLLTSCIGPGYAIDEAIFAYSEIESRIRLGDTMDQALPILRAAQSELEPGSLKNADRYYDDQGKSIYIHYQRTGRQPDSLTTDDEFTPFVFMDDTLIAVGWQSLGGPKSQGQVVQEPARVYVPPAPNIKSKSTQCTSQKVGNTVQTNCY